MGKRRLLVGLILMALVLLLAASWLYIRPSKTLDMNYTEIAWRDKLRQMVETRKPEITITQSELNQLAKKGLAENISSKELPFEVSGSEFQLNGDRLLVYINGAWGPVEFGAEVEYSLVYSEGKLILQPEKISIRHISVPPQQVGLEPIVIDMTSYFPDFIKIEEVDFPGKAVTVKFALDWLEIASYLNLL
ncbi:hypothetical protein FHR92_001266 [Fontibacillus solani]|uniref:DUF2140 domain-containing protein n=1 Tax=Fontibacillus solani TaxID=1572857 RepID=A0A7W3SRA3_9BACL|nr:hypothetical protein [Fontibacillus solani]MBA9084805.1 hypothetical protein [Fontibacillus solani]